MAEFLSLNDLSTRSDHAHTQETNYTYGPQNQIETVTGPSGEQFDYLYDESGMRLAKVRRSDGKLMLAYLGAGVHDCAALTTPISIAGVNIGTLRKGKLTAHASDIRGTVLGAAAGTGISSSPSPYGARSIEPDVASVTSFIEQPFDRDLGLVRLGVRDYDPKLGRFIQPDPLYQELPGFTLGDHVGANLYSYANNDPINFIDPWGLKATSAPTETQCKRGEACVPVEVDMPPVVIHGDTPQMGQGTSDVDAANREKSKIAWESYQSLAKQVMSERSYRNVATNGGTSNAAMRAAMGSLIVQRGIATMSPNNNAFGPGNIHHPRGALLGPTADIVAGGVVTDPSLFLSVLFNTLGLIGSELKLARAITPVATETAARTVASIEGVVTASGGSIRQAVAAANRAGLSQTQTIEALTRVIEASGRNVGSVVEVGGARVLTGVVAGVGQPIVHVSANGVATLGSATVSFGVDSAGKFAARVVNILLP